MLHSDTDTPPYPGLRPFRREETHLFFGREGCVNSMVDRLGATRFLAVLGSSGTGKSSLVRIGLLDALELGLMATASSRWQVAEFRPRNAPRYHLARSLLASEVIAGKTGSVKHDEKDIDLLRSRLEQGPRSVIEWCLDQHLPDNTNLLLLIDQFEELFVDQDYAAREEAEAFVALLLESVRSEDVPIYVTLTMRSEYLGACALIDGLADAINAGMYLTPRMTREQCCQAIEGPANVCGIKIDPALVNCLLNDLANFAPWDEPNAKDQLDPGAPLDRLTRIARRADQLPLLQYTLNRLWTIARDQPPRPIVLTLSDYLHERVGGLRHALDRHANEILEKRLGKLFEPVVERVFQRLTAGSTIAEAVRLKIQFSELVALGEADNWLVKEIAPNLVGDTLRWIIDAFREPECNFLISDAEPKEPVESNTFIEISHESIIRQWTRLSEWLAKEAWSSEQWRTLNKRFSDFASDQAAGRKGEWLHGRELENLIFWSEKARPNAVWANRYNYGFEFDKVIGFLRDSQNAALRQAKETRRKRTITAGIIALVCGGFLFSLLLYIQKSHEAEVASLKSREMELADQNQKDEAEKRESELEADKRQEEEELMGVMVFDMGQQLADLPDQESAEPSVSKIAEFARTEMQKNPASTSLKWSYVASLMSLGDVELNIFDKHPEKKDRLEKASKSFDDSYNTCTALITLYGNTTLWEEGLSQVFWRKGAVEFRRANETGARIDYENCLHFVEDLMNRDPEDNDLRDRLRTRLEILNSNLEKLGNRQLQKGNTDEAKEAFHDLFLADEQKVKVERDAYGKKQDDDAKHRLATALGLDSWSAVLNDQVEHAEQVAEEALKLDSSQTWIRINLAHACLCLGRSDDAKALYLDLKSLTRPSGKSYLEDIKEDFMVLQKLDIETAEIDRLKSELGI